jgi:CcmD family protein
MRRILGILILASLGLVAPLPAQTGAGAADSLPAQTAGASDGALSAPTEANGLPLRETPPRTLRAYWHVFAVFAIAWILLFGYALSLGRRFARVERELRRLG